MVADETEMNGAVERPELVWMNRAAISLPAPAGPLSITRPLDFVNFSSCDLNALNAGLDQSISEKVTKSNHNN